MAHRGGQDPQPGYMDEVCVKISEKYKPPPRINLAITYAQRSFLNKQIQDNIIHYDFSLETSIKNKVKELRNARKQLYEEKKDRLEKLKQARLRYNEKVLETENSNKDIDSKLKDSKLVEANEILKQSLSDTTLIYPSSYSHILTPIPLSNVNTSQSCQCSPNDKSPFNISDFEADTSSPFDNMELKTINDIEELAQVLKKEEATNITYNTSYTEPITKSYSNFPPLPSTSSHSTVHSNFAGQDRLNLQYSPYTPQTACPFVNPNPTTTYNNMNGYYYNYDVIQKNLNQNFKPERYQYNFDDSSSDKLPQGLRESTTIKNVPNIMKALESELDNTHICKNGVPSNVNEVIRPNKSYDRGNEQVIKPVELGDVYELLPKNLQYLSKDISLMGFPLSRVARVCQLLGDNQKKIVEHLLVMSELLDLGFSEEDVSRALLQCNNDRDKALDILIA